MLAFRPSTTSFRSLASRCSNAQFLYPSRSFSSGAPSAELVKTLREQTGSSIGKCRSALLEENGDLEKAKQWLRQKNVQVAKTKWESRETKEGIIAAHCTGTTGLLIDFGAETDFVIKSKLFQDFVVEVAASLHDDPHANVGDKLVQVGAQLGEKVQIERTARIEGKCIGAYVHSPSAGDRHYSTVGHTGAMVSLKQHDGNDVSVEELQAMAQKVARHIVAYRPSYVRVEDVPEEVVESERQIFRAQTAGEEKPEAVLEKMLNGKLQQFFSNEVLLRQSFLYDDKQSVEAVLLKANMRVENFSLLSRQ